MNEDPAIEVSTLSQEVTKNGQSVEVEIYRLEGASEWSLEVVDEFDGATVWADTFKTPEAALAEVHKVIDVDGIESLIGPEE